MTNKPLNFQVLDEYKSARRSILKLPHATVETPIYMFEFTFGKQTKARGDIRSD